MALGTGLLVFSLVLIVAFQSAVARKRANSDDSNYNVLVNHLVNVSGIERCNIFTDRYFESRVVDKIQAKLVKFLPIMSIKLSRKLSLTKYDRKRVYYISSCRKRPDILNSASGDSLLIYFYQPSSRNNFHQSIKWFRNTLLQPSSAPKVLLIALTNKPLKSYKTTLYRLFKTFDIVDVEILEISKTVGKSKKRKNGLKQQSHGFSVHRYNPFTRIYKKQRLTKRVQWFQTKTMNLHGSKIKYNQYSSYGCEIVLNRKRFAFSSDMCTAKSKFGTALKSLTNGTYVYEQNDAHFIFEGDRLTEMARSNALKPHSFHTIHIYTPVISDTYIRENLTEFFLFFPLIVATVLMLNLLSRFSQFNPRIWSPLAIFKMLLGKENPTGATGSLLETLLFILISFTGFFFSNEFSNAVTGILNPITIERHFNTFEDIREGNMTMFLYMKPVSDIDGYPVENPILKSKVRYLKTYFVDHFSYRSLYRAMGKMLFSSNSTVSYPESPMWVPLFGQTMQVDGKTLIKRSGTSEIKWVFSYPIRPFSPYNERMSDIYWRFHESGFHDMMSQTAFVSEVHKLMRQEYFLKTQRQDTDDDSTELEINFCLIYCVILLIGSTLAILVLIAEILLTPISNNNQIGNRVGIEDDANFICFEYEFHEYQESEIAQEVNEGEPVEPTDEALQSQNENGMKGMEEHQSREESSNEIVVWETFDIEEIAED